MRFESTRLFLERAQSQHPALVLTPGNVRGVVSICQQLNGLPLAIELAAARVGALSVEQIAARLNDCLKLLTLGDRTAPPRQRTLRRALDWSYNLLSESEQRLFERLSVFLGGWTLEAAEAVGAGDGIDEGDVLDLLSRLVDKSLVLVEAAVEGALRYKMLEPARQYGLERLEARGEAGPVRRRHASWFLELAEEAEPELKGAWQEEWSERLERERGNLRTALSWALQREESQLALRLAGALGEFWHLRGHLSEGRRWLEAALMKREALAVPVQAKALARVGCIAWEQGDYERSIAFSEESLALSRKVGDTSGAAAALSNLAWAALYQNKLGRASMLAEETVTLQRASRDMAGLARALLILGMVAAVRRDYERATVLHKKSLRLARKAKDNFAVILSLALGAFTSLGQGDYKRAGSLCAEGLELSWQLKMKQLTAAHLHILAALAGLQGRPVRSARLWGSAEALREALGTVLSPVERYVYGPHISAARARVDEAAWEAAWAEGRAMKIEVIANYTLSEEVSDSATAPVPEELSAGGQQSLLTPREREVAVLVGQGLSNRQIATQLVLSEHTVATHIHKSLKKLRLDSRVQIAAWIAKQPPLLLGPD